MRKLILSLSFLVLSTLAIFADGISVDYAKQVARNFYNQNKGKAATVALVYENLNSDNSNGVAPGVPLYYVFSTGEKGFVIISADDLVKPVLGYSTDQPFSIQNAPPVITGWLQKYSAQIAFVKVNRTTTTTEVTSQWKNLYNNTGTLNQLKSTAVNPLVSTTWDQDLYYNAMCPQDASSPQGYGGNVPTGCGATAMSQIIRYWGSPAQGTGSNSYSSNYGTLSANFGATTYNWANMPNSVTSANSDVATIMFDCGVAVDMVYGPNESSSYLISGTGVSASCEAAYTTYFGDNASTMQGLLRSNYADADWLNLIETELTSSRPIQYAGSGPDGGHTFVLDGTDGNDYFHINWGWSGTDNGYYTVDGLIPSPDANGSFDTNESMLIGIQPTVISVVSSGIDLYAATTVTPDPIAFDSTFTVFCSVVNTGTAGFNGNICAALFDANGNFIRFIGDIFNTGGTALGAGNYYVSGLYLNDTTAAVTVPGTYTIGIYYAATGANTWTLAGASTYTNPITVTINGPFNSNISLYSNITASPTTLIQSQGATITVNLINNGTATYTGEYEAALLDLYGNFIEQIGTYTESTGLPAGDVYNAPFINFTTNNITAPEGQYILAIGEEATGTSNWYYCGGLTYSNPVLIDVVNTGFALAVNNVSTQTIKVYPNPASDNITIDAGELRGDYNLKIFNTVGQAITESNGVLNGQTLNADVSDYATGMYVIQLKTEAGILNSKVVVK